MTKRVPPPCRIESRKTQFGGRTLLSADKPNQALQHAWLVLQWSLLLSLSPLVPSAPAQTNTNRTATAATSTNQVQAAESKKPSESKPEEKLRPSFKPKEKIPVDQGVDFPVDI